MPELLEGVPLSPLELTGVVRLHFSFMSTGIMYFLYLMLRLHFILNACLKSVRELVSNDRKVQPLLSLLALACVHHPKLAKMALCDVTEGSNSSPSLAAAPRARSLVLFPHLFLMIFFPPRQSERKLKSNVIWDLDPVPECSWRL